MRHAACPCFRRGVLVQRLGSQRLSPSTLGASTADALSFTSEAELVEKAPTWLDPREAYLGQEPGVRNVGERGRCKHWDFFLVPWRQAGRELRLARPSNHLQPSNAVLYTEGSVAVPCDAVKASLDGLLANRAKAMWGQWQGSQFAWAWSRRGATCVPILIRDSRAGLLMQMVRAGGTQCCSVLRC